MILQTNKAISDQVFVRLPLSDLGLRWNRAAIEADIGCVGQDVDHAVAQRATPRGCAEVRAQGEECHARKGENIVRHGVLRLRGSVHLIPERKLHVANVQVAPPRVVWPPPVQDGRRPHP